MRKIERTWCARARAGAGVGVERRFKAPQQRKRGCGHALIRVLAPPHTRSKPTPSKVVEILRNNKVYL